MDVIPRQLILAVACLWFCSGCLVRTGRKPQSSRVPLVQSLWTETMCKAKNVASATKARCGFRAQLPRQACEPKPYLSLGYWYKKDMMVVRQNAKQCAHGALRKLGGRFSQDYKEGFVTAYEDISSGASGETPPVPPEKYWKAHFRTNRGRARAQQWFEGYRSGAQHAEATGFTRFNDIAVAQDSLARDRGSLTPAGYMMPVPTHQAGMMVGPTSMPAPTAIPTPNAMPAPANYPQTQGAYPMATPSQATPTQIPIGTTQQPSSNLMIPPGPLVW